MKLRLAAVGFGNALIVAGIFLAAVAHAQWAPNGVQLTSELGDYPFIVSDGVGGAIVVWRDLRNPGGLNSDVRAQRVTSEGVIPSGWPADGVPVCTAPSNQDHTYIISDGDGGAYMAWIDPRNYDATRHDIYLQRLTAGGEVYPGWAVNGNLVCGAPGDQWLPRLAPDGTGGTFVVWEDFRVTGFVQDRSQVDIYAQRITPEGLIAPGWPADGLPVCTVRGGRATPNVLSDGHGGVFIQWVEARTSATTAADIYAIRITSEGQVAEGWIAEGTPICAAPSFQNYAVMTSDEKGGFIVSWQDARGGVTYDIYAQRVTPSGTIAPGWPDNGVAICTAPDLQQEIAITSDGAGGAFVVWSDYRNLHVSASDLYGQRVLANGEIAPGWPVDGVALSRAPGFDLASSIVPDGQGGALIAFESNQFDLRAQHLTASGAIAPSWDPNGERLCDFSGQQQPAAISDGKGGMIVAWHDLREGVGGIYAQRVGSDYPTPTLLALVSIQVEPERVVLTWHDASEPPTSLMAYRRAVDSDWIPLGAPSRSGDGLEFEDRSVTEGRYAYRLGFTDGEGERFTPEEWVTVPGAHRFTLSGFFPNPAMGEPFVSFSLADHRPARLELFDITGRVVVAVELEGLGPGAHRVALGNDVRLAAGAYWLRLTQGRSSLVTKGLVLR